MGEVHAIVDIEFHPHPRPFPRRGERGHPRIRTLLLSVLLVPSLAAAGPATAAGIVSFVVSGDAVGQPLDGKIGDAARGRAIVLDRQNGNCLICHAVPNEPGEMFQGDVGPSLAGIGTRLSPAQIRLRVIDQRRVNAASVMPSFYRLDWLNRVAARYAGKPVLDAQQIEDVVAYLSGFKE